MLTPLKESYDQPRQRIKKQRHYFVHKGPSSQGYSFSSSHVWMWELEYKESWELKNWCFWTVVLEKTLESPLDCKEIQPVHLKGRRRRDGKGWDGWMASMTQWTWVCVDSRSWWWTGRPGVLRFMGLQSVRHNWMIELNWTGILSLPLAWFIVILPKAHLTSHSSMSGSRWVITPSWVMKIFFVQFFCVFLAPFLNIFCFC